MTGIAIVIYLNQTPTQPRERDYAYAGSFYAFAIWIGFGVLGIVEGLKKLKLSGAAVAALASLICLLVPVQMASQIKIIPLSSVMATMILSRSGTTRKLKAFAQMPEFATSLICRPTGILTR